MNLISYTHTNFKIHRHLFILPWGYLNPKKASACWGRAVKVATYFREQDARQLTTWITYPPFPTPKAYTIFFNEIDHD